MRHLITGLLAIGLAAFGALISMAGVIYPFGAAANGGLGSGQVTTGMLAFAAALFVGGIALVLIAVLVWRHRRRSRARS